MKRIELLHKKGTFGNFVEELDNLADTINLLDFPVEDGYAPDLIKYVKFILSVRQILIA